MNKINLRGWQPTDAEQLAYILNNRNVWNNLRDIIPNPYTQSDADWWINHVSGNTPVLNFAVLFNDVVVGSIGGQPKEDVYKTTIEIGYFVGEEWWAKGIATEAVKQMTEKIIAQNRFIRIEAHVFASNKASMHVLRKNGYQLEGIQRKAVTKNDAVQDEHIWVKLI